MNIPRVIPCLLLKNNGLVKTVKFKNAKYVGDPINAVKIFNDKEVDELAFLDITASVENRAPRKDLIANIASECFMPMSYGGGIKNVQQMREILNLGVEKVIINSAALESPEVIQEGATSFGSQSIVVSIDVRKKMFGGYEVYTHCGLRPTGYDPVKYACMMERLGAGELLLTSIDREGTMSGYDLDLIRLVSKSVKIPVIASGGANSVTDFRSAVCDGSASAVSAGSMFVFHGPHRAVLINYPPRDNLIKTFQ